MDVKYQQHCQQFGVDPNENPENESGQGDPSAGGNNNYNRMHVMNFGVKKAGMTTEHDAKLG